MATNRTVCTACKSVVTLAEPAEVGDVVPCPKCEQYFTVPKTKIVAPGQKPAAGPGAKPLPDTVKMSAKPKAAVEANPFAFNEADKAKKKPVVAVVDDEDEDKPKKKPVVAVVDDEDEDEKPKKKAVAVVEDDEDDDTPKKKKKRRDDDDDDDDDRPKKKKKKKKGGKSKSGGGGGYQNSVIRYVILGILLLVLGGLLVAKFVLKKDTAVIKVPAKTTEVIEGED